MNSSTKVLCCVCAVLLFPPAALGANHTIEIGEETSVHSEILNENRTLLVYLPESYRTSTFRYPVLYLLDGDSEFFHTAGIVELYPDQPEGYWHVGDAYVLSGQLQKAKRYFEIALQVARDQAAPDLEDYQASLDDLKAKLKEASDDQAPNGTNSQ